MKDISKELNDLLEKLGLAEDFEGFMEEANVDEDYKKFTKEVNDMVDKLAEDGYFRTVVCAALFNSKVVEAMKTSELDILKYSIDTAMKLKHLRIRRKLLEDLKELDNRLKGSIFS